MGGVSSLIEDDRSTTRRRRPGASAEGDLVRSDLRPPFRISIVEGGEAAGDRRGDVHGGEQGPLGVEG
jgi:hypothetical protein